MLAHSATTNGVQTIVNSGEVAMYRGWQPSRHSRSDVYWYSLSHPVWSVGYFSWLALSHHVRWRIPCSYVYPLLIINVPFLLWPAK